MSEAMKIVGFVARVSEYAGTSKAGRAFTAYSARIEKVDGTEYPFWFQFGFDKPNLKEGDYVQFSATDKGDGKSAAADPASIKHGKNPPARAAKPERAAGGGGYSGPRRGGGGYKADGTGIGNRTNPLDASRMSYQNSRTAAISLVEAMIAADCLPLTKAGTKAGEAKRFDEVLAVVNKLTVQFFKDTDGDVYRLLDTVVDGGADSSDKTTESPASDKPEPAVEAEEAEFESEDEEFA